MALNRVGSGAYPLAGSPMVPTSGYVGSSLGTSNYLGTIGSVRYPVTTSDYVGNRIGGYSGSMRYPSTTGISTSNYTSGISTSNYTGDAGLLFSSPRVLSSASTPLLSSSSPSKDLKAAGRVVDERPISREELLSRGKIVEAPAVEAPSPSIQTFPVSSGVMRPSYSSGIIDAPLSSPLTYSSSYVPPLSPTTYSGGVVSAPVVSSGLSTGITPTTYKSGGVASTPFVSSGLSTSITPTTYSNRGLFDTYNAAAPFVSTGPSTSIGPAKYGTSGTYSPRGATRAYSPIPTTYGDYRRVL